MASLPDFFLINPVDRGFAVNARFNAPRDYSFAPTRLQLHEGIDLRAIDTSGSPVAVFAAQRGMVEKVDFSAQGYGNYVRIRHEWGDQTYVTWYGHLSVVTIPQGQFVLAGQKLGIAGTTGFSTGIHLHLTLQHIGHGLKNYVVDDVVNPEPLFKLDSAHKYDEAWFVADVTVPDGTALQPNQVVRKTWRLRNSGTTTWDANYRLAFVGDEQMGAPNEAPLLGGPVQPGQTTDMTVRLTAPSQAGTHRSAWQMRNPAGEIFPNKLFAEIVIKDTKPFDLAAFVADVTVEDGTVIQPGATFTKTWRVRNAGTTTWTTAYSLRHAHDNRMSGPDSVSLPRDVKPGEMIEISVPLAAPTTPGRQRSAWKLHNAQGQVFDHELYAEIQVPEQKTPTGRLSEARWLADVTVPDNTVMQPGAKFVKTWRARNSGETTWGDGYELAFFSGEQMGAPNAVPLPAADPGEIVEVSVTLTAPTKAGTYRSAWKGRDPQGKVFEFELFTIIEVEDTTQVTSALNELMFVADVTIPDGTAVKPGESFVKTWRVRNTGNTTWGEGYALAFSKDDQMGGPDSVALPLARPGETGEVSLKLTAPKSGGMRRSTWKARDPQGKVFDYVLFALVDVVDPSQTHDMLKFLRGDGRLYDLRFNWAGGGSQRLQTLVEGDRFYHVKFREWEELWADEQFIYRGTDTSPGGGEVYTLTENGQYGSPWIPRRMTIGVTFRRTPLVIFRRKSDGVEVPGKKFVHTTWIKLEEVRSSHKFSSGIELKNVAVLAALEDAGGKPGTAPFERYYYAENYGLVAWQGSLGESVIEHEFALGTAPNNEREVISWLKR